MRKIRGWLLAGAALNVAAAACALGDSHPTGVPQFSSDPGAPYTIYLDFAGFNFTGAWGGSGGPAPGNCASFDGTTSTFGATEQKTILNFAGYAANAFAPFNVNVTTIDPAVAAGQANTDSSRQAYYDSQPGLIHTIVTTTYQWNGSSGGVSFIGTAPFSYNSSGVNGGAGAGWHSNWFLVSPSGMSDDAGRTAAHEDGHVLGLSHQSDYAPGSPPHEYTSGDHSLAPGTYGAIMGYNGFDQRSTWRMGTSSSSAAVQNDAAVIVGDAGMNGYRQDGVGHSLASATALPLNGSQVAPLQAHGIIVPATTSNPNPIGTGNYTQDFWRFISDGVNPITLKVSDGNDLLTTGAPDGGPTLRSKLQILTSSGGLYAAASEDSSTLSETFSGALPAGVYYADVSSFGGHTQTLSDGNGGFYDTTYYYDTGGYFMTGSGFVPEPGSIALLLVGGCAALFRGRHWWASGPH